MAIKGKVKHSSAADDESFAESNAGPLYTLLGICAFATILGWFLAGMRDCKFVSPEALCRALFGG